MPERKRSTAFFVPLSALLRGRYVKSIDEFSPNYLELGNSKISRVNIIGIVVGKGWQGEGNSFFIDDGTAKMLVRCFDARQAEKAVVGAILNVIGTVREFNGERYLSSEIIKATTSQWMMHRKQQLIAFPAEPVEESTESASSSGAFEKVLSFIRQKDEGEGVEIDSIFSALSITDGEKIIESLLKEGDIFKNRPGRVKLLE